MTVLIVGADRIDSFAPRLEEWGAKEIVHWTARNHRSALATIPKKADLIICCTNYLSHNMAKSIKKQAKQRSLPTIYCRRSWTEVEEGLVALQRHGHCRRRCELYHGPLRW